MTHKEESDFALNAGFEGRPLEECTAYCDEHSYVWRLIHLDGTDLPVLRDYNDARINFSAVDGIVTGAKYG